MRVNSSNWYVWSVEKETADGQSGARAGVGEVDERAREAKDRASTEK